MTRLLRTIVVAAPFLAVLPVMGAADAPYAGQDTRAIAALSEDDVADLLAGRGWGFAKPAELNGYPGPAHVLELAEPLELTETQIVAVEAAFATMADRARDLGAQFVEAEAALDQAFAGGELDAAEMQALTKRAGSLRAELRAVHLAAHLEIKPLLSPHQIMMYNRLRGYGAEGEGGHDQHQHQH